MRFNVEESIYFYSEMKKEFIKYISWLFFFKKGNSEKNFISCPMKMLRISSQLLSCLLGVRMLSKFGS